MGNTKNPDWNGVNEQSTHTQRNMLELVKKDGKMLEQWKGSTWKWFFIGKATLGKKCH